MKSIEVITYSGSKRCCGCGRISSYTVKVDGYQFTTCSDCVNNFFPEEEEETHDSSKNIIHSKSDKTFEEQAIARTIAMAEVLDV